MPGPKAPEIRLTVEQRQELEHMVRARTTEQQLAQRARVILLAADGMSTAGIGREVHLVADGVRRWRSRWLERAQQSVLERLTDAPKSGRRPRITPEQVCQMVALACEKPSESNRPISHWSVRELARESVRRGIVERISPRQIGRILKRGGTQAPPDPVVADPGRRRRRANGADR